MTEPIYMDHHATTPVDARVVDAMLPYLTEKFGNIASSHCYGKAVSKACKLAREHLGRLIQASASEVVFTSGATESNNLAIKGMAEGLAADGRHIITCETEHKAVLDTCAYLERHGWAVTYLPVDQHGRVSADQVIAAVRNGDKGSTDRTVLVSIMGANNEIGTIHPFIEIGEALSRLPQRVFFHVDGAQTAGKIPLDVNVARIDLLSISGHKIYGPKGIGALFVNADARAIIEPQMHGGGQESGLRAGTLPVHLVVGMGEAARLCYEELEVENRRLAGLRARLEEGLQGLGRIKVNGHPIHRLPGNLNVTFEGIDSELLMLGLKNVAVSSTSACSSSSPEPSYVLRAIGRTVDEAYSSIRFGLGRLNTAEHVDYVLACIGDACRKFRKPSHKANAG